MMRNMTSKTMTFVASVLILVASVAVPSDAHGLITMPPMRTAFSLGEDNPHGYSGGGASICTDWTPTHRLTSIATGAAANAGGREYVDSFPPVGTAPACGKSNAMSPGRALVFACPS